MSKNEKYPDALPSRELKPGARPVFRNDADTPPTIPPSREIARITFEVVYADKLGEPKTI